MEAKLLKSLLSRFSKSAFQEFCFKLLNEGDLEYKNMLRKLSEIDNGIFERYIPSSISSALIDTFIVDYFPIEIFKDVKKIDISNGGISKKLNKYFKLHSYQGIYLPTEKGAHMIYILNNFHQFTLEECEEILLNRYEEVLNIKSDHYGIGMGNCSTFVDKQFDITNKIFTEFISENYDGINITLNQESANVSKYNCEKQFFCGVCNHSLSPIEPIYCQKNENYLIREFENLINNEVKESVLEDFLRTYYKQIFGFKYDRIETQLWLKFPQFDINDKRRRLDIFLRNSVKKDWELYELKRSIKLTSTYRDIPVFIQEVSHAIQQLRNYHRILIQDEVKRKFEKEGIKYYEPTLNLVIGRKPQIDHAQWRNLVSTNIDNIKLINYDELLEEMKIRLTEYNKII